jgi:6-phosphogluconate dehydrogenase
MRDLRMEASVKLRGPNAARDQDPTLKDALRDALYCSKICSYAQGLDLLATVDREKGWGVDLAEVARIWKGGCIIRARFLQRIQQAYGKGKKLANLLLDDELGGFLVERQAAWRKVVALGAQHGIPMLAMGGSLSYFDSFRRARLPQNLTQAQRDFFGSHTFERTDGKPGEFVHHEWRN